MSFRISLQFGAFLDPGISVQIFYVVEFLSRCPLVWDTVPSLPFCVSLVPLVVFPPASNLSNGVVILFGLSSLSFWPDDLSCGVCRFGSAWFPLLTFRPDFLSDGAVLLFWGIPVLCSVFCLFVRTIWVMVRPSMLVFHRFLSSFCPDVVIIIPARLFWCVLLSSVFLLAICYVFVRTYHHALWQFGGSGGIGYTNIRPTFRQLVVMIFSVCTMSK